VAEEQDAGDRTEQPTPKKLRDARERGDVSKSKEIGSTVGLLAFALVAALLGTFAGTRLTALFDQAIAAIGRPFETASAEMISAASWTVFALVLAVAVPVALLALIAEFLQVGPVFTGKKMEPKLERLDPVAGLKRMFGMDNLVELVKSVLKTLVLLAIAVVLARSLLPEVAGLPLGGPGAFGEALRSGWVRLVAWTVAVFAAIAVADALYQRYAYLKRLRMSIREIRRELKEDEGDPYLKQHRRQQHEELNSGSTTQLARSAHMLVVNPTHVSIALDYHPQRCPVPTVAAKGEDAVALAMREAARESGVPILRDVPLARALLERAPIGEAVPDDLFEAVAHAVVWARTARDRASGATSAGPAGEGRPGRRGNARGGASGGDSDSARTTRSTPHEGASDRAPRRPPLPPPPEGRSGR
jgi:type III secretion protein U